MKLNIKKDRRPELSPSIELAYSAGSVIEMVPNEPTWINHHPPTQNVDINSTISAKESIVINDVNSLLRIEIKLLKSHIKKLNFEKSLLIKWTKKLF